MFHQAFPDPTVSCSAEEESPAGAGGTGESTSADFYFGMLNVIHLF